MSLDPTEQLDEAVLLGFAQALEPGALGGVDDRTEAVRQLPSRSRELDQEPSPIPRMWNPSHQVRPFEGVDQPGHGRSGDKQAITNLAGSQRPGGVRQHAQDEAAGGTQAEWTQDVGDSADDHVSGLDQVHGAFGG